MCSPRIVFFSVGVLFFEANNGYGESYISAAEAPI